MGRRAKQLTEKGLRAFPPRKTPYRDFGDGAATGLYVHVGDGAKGRVRSWLYRYNSPTRILQQGKNVGKSKERCMGVGPCELIGIAEAREFARAARRLVKEGRDPIDERNARKNAARQDAIKLVASTMTFRACVDQYLSERLGRYRNPKHREQWRSTLKRATDAFGGLNVADVDTATVVKFIKPIWNVTPETGSRLRGRIEKVLDWAKVHGFRDGENPARWSGHLEHVLPARKKAENMPAMQFAHVPEFMGDLRKKDTMSAAALEFLVLTVAPSIGVRGARWEEIDLASKTWTIPQDRMKNRADKLGHHVIPLSDRALEVLEGLPREETGLIFPGDRAGVMMSENTMNEMLKDMHAARATEGLPPWADYVTGKLAVVHGFRSSFRDWAGERTSFDREIIEFAMAHAIPDKTDAAYRRYSALNKRCRDPGLTAHTSGKSYAARPIEGAGQKSEGR